MMKPENAGAPISVAVIAGGRSRRLGQDKRRLRLWGAAGPTLLEHTLAALRPYTDDLVVVMNDGGDWPDLKARVVADEYPDGGALGGIYSGLVAARHPYVFVVAADMPLLNTELIGWMIRQPRTWDVFLPRLGSERARNRLGVESLHGIYGAACREPIRRQLEAGNPQVIGFFGEVRVEFVEPDLVARFDPRGVAFKNVNTPEELAEVRRLLGSAG